MNSSTQQANRWIGRYGLMRKAYLEEHQPKLLRELTRSGRLSQHLVEADAAARRRLKALMPALARNAGATETLKARDQLAQEQHRLQRMENRQTYLGDKTRKQRAHRLITRGAAVESVFPDVKDLSEPEFYELVEHASEIPAVISLVMDAADKHNQAAAKKEVS